MAAPHERPRSPRPKARTMRAESGRTSKAVRLEFEECGDIPELPTTCPQGWVPAVLRGVGSDRFRNGGGDELVVQAAVAVGIVLRHAVGSGSIFVLGRSSLRRARRAIRGQRPRCTALDAPAAGMMRAVVVDHVGRVSRKEHRPLGSPGLRLTRGLYGAGLRRLRGTRRSSIGELHAAHRRAHRDVRSNGSFVRPPGVSTGAVRRTCTILSITASRQCRVLKECLGEDTP